MNGKSIFKVGLGVLLAIVVIGLAAGVGFGGYRLGYMQGLAQEGKIVIAAPGGGETPVEPGAFAYRGYAPFGYGYGPGWHRPFGGGFGFLGCLVPLAIFFVFFSVMRMVFFRRTMWGHGPWGHHGPPGEWRDRAPTHFDEWHKRAHGETPKPEGGESPSA